MKRKDRELLAAVKKKKRGGFLPFHGKVTGGAARRRPDRAATGGVTPAPAGGAVKQKFQAGGDVTTNKPPVPFGERYGGKAVSEDIARRTESVNRPDTEQKWLKGRDQDIRRNYARGGHLSAAGRRALPGSDFALPGKGKGPEGKGSGSYPIPDEGHAKAALSRGAANASPGELATIKRKVKAKFPGMKVS